MPPRHGIVLLLCVAGRDALLVAAKHSWEMGSGDNPCWKHQLALAVSGKVKMLQ